MIASDFNKDNVLNTMKNGDKISPTKNKADEITNILSTELPKGYNYMYLSGENLVIFLQETGLMYKKGYLEEVEKRLKYVDRNEMYKKNANFLLFYKNKIVGCSSIQINPENSQEARFSFVNIDKNHQNKGLAKFLIHHRFMWIKNRPNILKIMVSNFSDEGKKYLINEYKKISEYFPDIKIYVSDDYKEKKLLSEYLEIGKEN